MQTGVGLAGGGAAPRLRSAACLRWAIASVPDRLYFTDSDEANELIAQDPMALLIGFALDQQVTVEKAFSGPLAIKERVGTLDPAKSLAADLEPVFREKPAVHRFPAKMAERVHDLAVAVRDEYDGDAARVWEGAKNSEQLRANIEGLPGFGEMKVKALRGRAREALQTREGQAAGAAPPHPRRRRLRAGQAGLPGGEEGPQGGVDEDERLGLGGRHSARSGYPACGSGGSPKTPRVSFVVLVERERLLRDIQAQPLADLAPSLPGRSTSSRPAGTLVRTSAL